MRAVLTSEPGDLVIPAPVTAEVAYLLRTRSGPAAARAFLADLASAAFLVESLTVEEHGLALETADRFRDLDVGLADLSIVVLAHRLKKNRVLTFDLGHFTVCDPCRAACFGCCRSPDPTLAGSSMPPSPAWIAPRDGSTCTHRSRGATRGMARTASGYQYSFLIVK